MFGIFTRTSISALFLCFALLALSAEAAPGINPEIPFHGVLKDDLGDPLTGSYDMTFVIYDAPTGGTALWTGLYTVDVTDGTFKVMLGSGGSTFGALDFTDDTYYIGLTVEADAEMTPRQRIGASAYAFNADKLDGYDSSYFLNLSASTSMATTSATTLFTLTQNGAGDILNLFSGASPVFTVNSTGMVGIGTSTPNSSLSIVSTGTTLPIETHSNFALGMEMYTHDDAGFRGPVLTLFKSRGTQSAPTAVQSGDMLGYIGAGAYDGTAYGVGAQITVTASENWGTSNHGSEFRFHTTSDGSGSLDTNPKMILTADGNLGIGTTTIPATLTVGGYVIFDNGTTSPNIVIRGRHASSSVWGVENTIINPWGTGTSTLTGNQNTAVGAGALNVNTSGARNTAIGTYALVFNTTGTWNTAIGYSALGDNVEGSYNTAIGFRALENHTSGNDNVALGINAGQNNLTGARNVFLGYSAGANETGSDKLYISNSSTSSPLIYGDFSSRIATINGKLGIGTSSPTSTLTVSGDVLVYSGTGVPSLKINREYTGTAAYSYLEFQIANQTKNYIWQEYFPASGINSIAIGSGNGTTAVRVGNGGELSVGAGGPGYDYATGTRKLSVRGFGSASTTYNTYLESSTDAPLFVVRDDGTVGIGTSSPSSVFHIVEPSHGNLILESQTGWPGFELRPTSQSGDYRSLIIQHATNGALQFRVGYGAGGIDASDDAPFRISASGTVAVGHVGGSGTGAPPSDVRFLIDNTYVGAGVTTTVFRLQGDIGQIANLTEWGNNGSTFSYSVVNPVGWFGIGTTSPSAMLAIAGRVGVTTSTPFFTIASTTDGTSTSTIFTVLANGNVGIGTSSPGSRLDVGGYGANDLGYTPNNAIRLYDNYNGITDFSAKNVSTGSLAAANIQLFDSGGSYVSLSMPGTGNSASALFGLARSTATYLFSNTVGASPARNMAIGTLGANTLTLGTNNVARITLDASGNVGIGTTSPSALLSISNSVGTTAGTPLFTIASTTGGTSTSTLFSISANGQILMGKNAMTDPTFFPDSSSVIVSYTNTNPVGFPDVPIAFNTYMKAAPASDSDANYRAGYFEVDLTGTVNYNQSGTAVSGASTVNTTGTVASLGSFDSSVYNASASSIDALSSYSSYIQSDTGTTTDIYGFYHSVGLYGGTTTNSYGVYLYNADVAGARLTNQYGLYIEDQTAGAVENYAIYSAGGKSYFAGNVGIGTTTPTDPLTVEGNVKIGDELTFGLTGAINSGGGLFYMRKTGSEYPEEQPKLFFQDMNFAGQVMGFGLTTDGTSEGTSLNIKQSFGDNVATFTDTGNFGVGSSSPNALLTVANTINTAVGTPLFTVASTTGGTSTSTLFTVLASGNVGIGTGTPLYKLSVINGVNPQSQLHFSAGNADSGGYLSSWDENAFYVSAGAGINASGQVVAKSTSAAAMGSDDGYLSFAADSGLTVGNTVALTERMRITPTGYVGIGTTTPTSALTLAEGTTATEGITMGDVNLFRGSSNLLVTGLDDNFIVFGSLVAGVGMQSPSLFGSSDAGGTLNLFGTSNATPGNIYLNPSGGNVGIGTTTPTQALTASGTIQATNLLGGATSLETDASGNIIRTPSDERLKENIEPLENSLEKLLELRGVSYEWKDEGRFGNQKEIGFIAQEVDLVLPEVVQKGGEYWSLNKANMLAVVVEAVKEMYAKVEEYFARTEALEAENAELKARIEALEDEVGITPELAPESTPDEPIPEVIDPEPENSGGGGSSEPTPEETAPEVPSDGEVPAEEPVSEVPAEEPVVEEVPEEEPPSEPESVPVPEVIEPETP